MFIRGPSVQRLVRTSRVIGNCVILTVTLPLSVLVTPAHSAPQIHSASTLSHAHANTSGGTAPFVPRAPRAIPLSIPVPDNALGDLNGDRVADIIDLLRLRDISHSIGAPPTIFELHQADLNGDGRVDSEDLLLLDRSLLRLQGLPAIVGSDGGEVFGAGVTLILAPGTLDSTSLVSARLLSSSEFTERFGTSPADELSDQNYFMGAFQIDSYDGAALQRPVQVSVRLDSIPPCQFAGTNALLEVLDDLHGDGHATLVFRNYMHPNADSTAIVSDSIPAPIIELVTTPMAHRSQGSGFPVGSTLRLGASGLSNNLADAVVMYAAGSFEVYMPLNDLIRDPDSQRPTALECFVPYLGPATSAQVTIVSLVNGNRSAPVNIQIDPTIQFIPAPRDSVRGFFADVDSYLAQLETCASVNAFGSPGDSLLPELIVQARSEFDSLGVLVVRDYDDTTIALCAAALQNAAERDSLRHATARLTSDCALSPFLAASPMRIVVMVKPIPHSGALGILMGLACAALSPTCAAGMASDPGALSMGLLGEFLNEAANSQNTPIPPPGPGGFQGPMGPSGGNSPTGGVDPNGGRHANGCCVNIYIHDFNLQGRMNYDPCMFGPCLGPGPSPELANASAVAKATLPRSFQVAQPSSPALRRFMSPLQGALVIPTNVHAAFGVVGIVNSSGGWVLPGLPLESTVAFAVYDPNTGLYDADAGSVVTGFTRGEFGIAFLKSFNPNRTTATHPLAVGNWTRGTITADVPNQEYRVYAGPALVGSKLNVGCRATGPLSVIVRAPSGAEVFNNGGTSSCSNVRGLIVAETGSYTVKIGRGTLGAIGDFAVGASVAPAPPTPFLCGDVEGRLGAGYFAYVAQDPAQVAVTDSVALDAGVVVEFQSGGSISSNGRLTGAAHSEAPILLRGVSPAPAPLLSRQPRATRQILGKVIAR